MFHDRPHIVFAGGGTAGHLFPGLAVAEMLRRWDWRITFVGTGKAFERRHVLAAGHEYLVLPSRPFSRKVREAILFLTDNVSGYYSARRFLQSENAALVVGLGGYASGATTRAARSLGIPYLLLEQNAYPGKATRWLAGGAALVCAAFADVRAHLPTGCRVRATGTPVRREFLARRSAAQARSGEPKRPRLIILGGSGGARALNEQVPAAVYKAQAALAGWEIVHQTGERDQVATSQRYRKFGVTARVAPFFDDLAAELAASDLAISRAGGSTLAELAVCGVPSILLPYPHAAANHQRKNADLLVTAGAARLIDEREVTGRLDNAIARVITSLASNPALRQRMTENLAAIARPDAARQVAKHLVGLLNSARAGAA